MNIDTAFPSKWIRAADLKNRDITMMISRVLQEEVGRDGTTQPVVYFSGTEKGLALNKTNAHTIADALGVETDNWTGGRITLYPTKTDFEGRRVDCIRIREQKREEPQPVVISPAELADIVPGTDSEIPF